MGFKAIVQGFQVVRISNFRGQNVADKVSKFGQVEFGGDSLWLLAVGQPWFGRHSANGTDGHIDSNTDRFQQVSERATGRASAQATTLHGTVAASSFVGHVGFAEVFCMYCVGC